MALLVRRGERACLKATPDAIAPAGNDAVEGIGQDGGNETSESGHGRPRKLELAKGG
jgi:hypothetical protein